MRRLNDELKQRFGRKVYKLSLSAAVTCPNRDGTIDTRGCIFCSAGGSGEFAADAGKSISEQLIEAKQRVAKKVPEGAGYIAYFQSFTNTYAPCAYLRRIFSEALADDEVLALSVGTRPDCLPDDIVSMLSELNQRKPVFVELGLQTIHERTAEYIRRGYPLSVYDDAVKRLKAAGIEVVVHVILGLPGETEADMLATVRYVCREADGIKLQLLHVLKGTDLAKDYEAGAFRVMELSEYTELLVRLVREIPDCVIVHRLTGDGPKKLLIAPLWSGDKKNVLNQVNRALREEEKRNAVQKSGI